MPDAGAAGVSTGLANLQAVPDGQAGRSTRVVDFDSKVRNEMCATRIRLDMIDVLRMHPASAPTELLHSHLPCLQQVLKALKSEGMSLQKIHVFLSQALKDVEVRASVSTRPHLTPVLPPPCYLIAARCLHSRALQSRRNHIMGSDRHVAFLQMETACLQSMRSIAAQQAQQSLTMLHEEALAVAGSLDGLDALHPAATDASTPFHTLASLTEVATAAGGATGAHKAADQGHSTAAGGGMLSAGAIDAAVPHDQAATAEAHHNVAVDVYTPEGPSTRRRRSNNCAAAAAQAPTTEAMNAEAAQKQGSQDIGAVDDDEHAALLEQLELAQDILGAGGTAAQLEACGIAPDLFNSSTPSSRARRRSRRARAGQRLPDHLQGETALPLDDPEREPAASTGEQSDNPPAKRHASASGAANEACANTPALQSDLLEADPGQLNMGDVRGMQAQPADDPATKQADEMQLDADTLRMFADMDRILQS